MDPSPPPSASDPSAAPRKDLENEHPIPPIWRAALTGLVRELAEGASSIRVDGVEVTPGEVAAIQRSVTAYGETLAELPAETWRTSVAQWMGARWDILVDLWTVESGRSDLVVAARVYEDGDRYRIVVRGVWVP